MRYIIGIDGGTQSTKVVIFDLAGRVVAEGRQALRPLLLPEPGVVLHPDDDLWDSLVTASRQALAGFPGQLSEIIGVGLCSIRCCRALLKEDGSLAYPVLNWMDRRLARPYEREYPAVRYVTTASGYMSRRITGQCRDTASNHLGEWPIDEDAWQWSADPEVLRRFQIPRDMLFDLVLPGNILGQVTEATNRATGIPAGPPVVATANDKAVEALGSGSLEDGSALISLGTYITSMVQGRENRRGADYFFSNMASIPHRYLYESGGIRRGMSTVSWIRELMGGDIPREAARLGVSPEDYLNGLAEKVPAGSEGLMTVPEWLAPTNALYKRGVMIGFNGRHTGAHMYRSILEAIALTMRNHCLAMAEELGKKLDRIIVSGGGASGDLFMQIFADVFGLPACRNEISGAVSLGAAICAAVGLGVYDNFETARDKMVRTRDLFAPDPANHKLYQEINEQVYRDITSYTDAVLQKSYPIFETVDRAVPGPVN